MAPDPPNILLNIDERLDITLYNFPGAMSITVAWHWSDFSLSNHLHTCVCSQEDEAARLRQEAEARALEARLKELEAKQNEARKLQEK